MDAGADDPLEDLRTVEKELEAYGHGLMDRPRLLVLNKQELRSDEELPALMAELKQASGIDPLCISAAMGSNLDALLEQIWSELGV